MSDIGIAPRIPGNSNVRQGWEPLTWMMTTWGERLSQEHYELGLTPVLSCAWTGSPLDTGASVASSLPGSTAETTGTVGTSTALGMSETVHLAWPLWLWISVSTRSSGHGEMAHNASQTAQSSVADTAEDPQQGRDKGANVPSVNTCETCPGNTKKWFREELEGLK